MSQKMKLFVFFSIISFLKYGYIVRSAFVKILIFISIYRVYFKSHHAEVFSCKFASLTDIIYITVSTALACKNQSPLSKELEWGTWTTNLTRH